MKTDRILGQEVRNYLIEKGVETPIKESKLNESEKVELIRDNMEVVIDVLGLDREDDSIGGTADRVAKMYVKELCSGLSYNRFPKISVFDNKMNYSSMVIQKDITFHSLCEHHFVNFNGMAQVAYIPNGHVIGLSKLNRIVNFFARRPQVQENLTMQIHDHIDNVCTGNEGVAVMVSANHMCACVRGVKHDATMKTSKLSGEFILSAKID